MLQILKCKSMISSPSLLGSEYKFLTCHKILTYTFVILCFSKLMESSPLQFFEVVVLNTSLEWTFLYLSLTIPQEDWKALTRTAKYVLDYLKYHAYFYYASIIFSNANLTARVFFLSGRPLHFSCFKRKFFLFELAWENFVRHF